MFDHAQQPRVAAKQVLPEISAAFHEEFLILTVGDFAQPPNQQTVAIILDQAVPITAPDHLDHIPARAAENSFQFLDDLAVAANRPIQPLQVAIDYPD